MEEEIKSWKTIIAIIHYLMEAIHKMGNVPESLLIPNEIPGDHRSKKYFYPEYVATYSIY